MKSMIGSVADVVAVHVSMLDMRKERVRVKPGLLPPVVKVQRVLIGKHSSSCCNVTIGYRRRNVSSRLGQHPGVTCIFKLCPFVQL
jgi:hypothetical protein